MLLIAIVVYFIIARAVVRRQQTKRAKYIATALFVLVPLGDMIPGLIYFYSLCALEGGQRIYKTVEVGPEYLLKPGEPDRSKSGVPPAVGGELNRGKILERYANPDNDDMEFSRLFHIVKFSNLVQDKQTSEVLGTEASFSYSGGWLINLLNEERSMTSCPGFSVYGTLLQKVIKPMSPIPGKGG